MCAINNNSNYRQTNSAQGFNFEFLLQLRYCVAGAKGHWTTFATWIIMLVNAVERTHQLIQLRQCQLWNHCLKNHNWRSVDACVSSVEEQIVMNDHAKTVQNKH